MKLIPGTLWLRGAQNPRPKKTQLDPPQGIYAANLVRFCLVDPEIKNSKADRQHTDNCIIIYPLTARIGTSRGAHLKGRYLAGLHSPFPAAKRFLDLHVAQHRAPRCSCSYALCPKNWPLIGIADNISISAHRVAFRSSVRALQLWPWSSICHFVFRSHIWMHLRLRL